jgi:cytochrome c biogenesis protein CcmG/thiol:disulfide interchange protein DsbE
VASVLAVLAVGLGACGGGDSGNAPTPDYGKALNGAPPKLAALYAKGDKLIEGDGDAVQSRLDDLHGFPVVVNAWASWCAPCRAEFPLFQQASAKLGTKVAFLGLDTLDSVAAAKTFLGEQPLPYPSFTSSEWTLADEFVPGVRGLPKTAYYSPAGKRVFVHQGPYTTLDQLESDIKHYGNRGR